MKDSSVKNYLPLLSIILFALFLMILGINKMMIFIGDQGWFYLSARDFILNGKVPLVGITSSHIWLHQGPIWTYLLSLTFLIFGFNPISGAYLSIIFQILSIFLIYQVGKIFFSRTFGLFAAILYSTSPLLVIYSRMPYHTTPIPFFVLLFLLSVINWTRGKILWFPIAILCLSFLYNFELATVVLWPVLLSILLYGYLRKESWIKDLAERKILFISFAAFIFPMIPVLIYDLQNGFPQTLKYGGWFFYKVIQLISLSNKQISEYTFSSVLNLFFTIYSRLVFVASKNVSITIFIVTMITSCLYFIKNKFTSPFNIIFFSTLILFLSFLVSNTPSEAYFPMMIPGFILILSFSFFKLYSSFSKVIALILFAALVSLNVFFLLSNNYWSGKMYGAPLSDRIKASEEILKITEGKPYNLIFKGDGSQFPSSIMNYKYLTWSLGKNPPLNKKTEIKILIIEEGNKIFIKKLNN